MGQKKKLPDRVLPSWFDGKTINEAQFCEEFLQTHRIAFANGAFFTPDGRVTDDLPLRAEIYEALKGWAISNIPKKISNILEVSESRISQLHTKALSKMKKKMGKYLGILTEVG